MQTLLRIAAWVFILLLFIVTDGPITLRPVTSFPPDIERFFALAVGGALFSLAYPRRKFIAVLSLAFVVGLFEVLQIQGLGRHGRVSDVVVKILGIGAGLLAVHAIETIRGYARSKR